MRTYVLVYLAFNLLFLESLGYLSRKYKDSRTSTRAWSILKSEIARIDRLSKKISDHSSNTWWGQGEEVNFKCTGCGKCCSNDGEVWLNTDELADLVMYLNVNATKGKEQSTEEILEKYADDFMPGWVKMKNKEIKQEDGSKTGGCIFLDEDGKKCTIYGARPVQCRTYPWWPRLLHNESTWNAEAIPEGKTWTPSSGGCEGINLKQEEGAGDQDGDSSIQSPTVIHRNKALYEYYTDAFPFMRGKADSGETDKSRLLSKVSLISAIVKSTKAWVKNFVVKYALCPFAERVFDDERISYRVYFNGVRQGNSDDMALLIDRVKYEMLDLLSQDEDDVATTLLMLPFAFSSFAEWNEFTVQLEDEVMPLLEREVRGPRPIEPLLVQGHGKEVEEVQGEEGGQKRRRSLLQKVKAKAQAQAQAVAAASSAPASSDRKCPADHHTASVVETSSLPDIQLAFFHPLFAWADTEDFNDPLNFEKRAPFPTINLLRAARVREYADEKRTSQISGDNVRALLGAGENIVQEFEDIIKIALTG